MKYILSLLIALFMVNTAYAKVTFPDRGNRAVYDPDNHLTTAEQNRLNQKLVSWQQKTKHQMVIAIIPDLQGLEVSDYGYQLGRAWHLGQSGQDDGLLLLIHPQGKIAKSRIEVGQGLESVVTDAKAKQILSDTMNPAYLKLGLAGSLAVGVDALTSYVDDNQANIAVRHQTPPSSSGSNIMLFIILAALALGAVAVFFSLRARHRAKLMTKFDGDDHYTENARYHESEYVRRIQSAPVGSGYLATKPFPYSSFERQNDDDNDFLPTVGVAAAGAVLGDLAASALDTDNDNDDNRYTTSSNDGFVFDNTDYDSFSGGGAEMDLGGDNS